jgi:G3E family GTPase
MRGEMLVDRELEAVEGDERSISDLLVDQVEFADVLVLNKTDLVSREELGTVEAVLRRLNPSARLVRAHHGVVDLSEVLDTGRYDPVTAAQAPGWAAELAGSHTPETEEYGISSVVYRAERPFHPARLAAAVNGWHGLLRSKGFCHIASRPDVLAVWSQAGPNLVLEPGQLLGADERDPGQELVFIGVGLDPDEPRRRLDAALLTDAELAAGSAAWLRLPDPLPEWDVDELHGHAHPGPAH